ncbi:MAG: hypothetical protein ACUZ8H_06405 [Candidatus Anammoxibacter sp.]
MTILKSIDKKLIKRDLGQMDVLYESIISACNSLSVIDTDKKELSRRIELIIAAGDNDLNIVSMLKESNSKISDDLNEHKKEYDALDAETKSVNDLVGKIERMDFIKSKLSGLKRSNTTMQLKIIPVLAKVQEIDEELFGLRKKRDKVIEEHAGLIVESSECAKLRKKILPKGKLLEIRDRLSTETSKLEKYVKSNVIENFKEELAVIIPERDELKQKLETAVERLASTEKTIKTLEEKVGKIEPKVISEEDAAKLEEEVGIQRKKKNELTQEQKALSPKIATLAEDEENKTSILESYKSKNKKAADKLTTLKKEMEELDMDKDSIGKFEEEVVSKEGDLEVKKGILDHAKKEYSDLVEANRRYKATIDEVDKITAKLDKAVNRGK